MSSRPTIPSVLDSPRFFDDESLSSWNDRSDLTSQKYAASKEEIRQRGFRMYASNGQSSSQVDPEHDADPIAVELVRGVNGPSDNSWTVVVDGMAQILNVTLFKSQDQADVGKNVYVCRLPPGVPLNKPITTSTKVRPIVVGVRLENEALHPSLVELRVDQVLDSYERSSREESDEKQMKSGIELKPYRVSDITASGVTMPYPYWSPPQSAIGVLSFQEANRESERNAATRLYNSQAIFMNGVIDQVYNARKTAYEEIKAAKWIQGESVKLFNLAKKYNNKLAWRDDQKIKTTFQSFQARIKPPKRPKLYALKLQNSFFEPITYDESNSVSLKQNVTLNQRNASFQDPAATKAKGSFVIGGSQKSAAKELAEMFKVFTEVCNVVNTELLEAYAQSYWPNLKLAIKEQIAAMRFALLIRSDSLKLVALFDALFTSNPFPSIATLNELNGLSSSNSDDSFAKKLMRRFSVTERTSPRAGEDQFDVEEISDETRTEFAKATLEAIQKTASTPATRADYAFMYDRLFWENRKKSALKTRFSIQVFDHGNEQEPFEVRFEASENDGFAAHSVYANTQQDIDECNEAAQEFVKCFYKAYLSSRNNALQEAVNIARGLVVNDKFLTRKYRNRQGSKFSGIFDVLRFIPNQAAKTVLTTLSNGPEFKNYNPDPERLEQRVSELRVMLQYTRPIMPMEDKSGVSEGFQGAINAIVEEFKKKLNSPSNNTIPLPSPAAAAEAPDAPAAAAAAEAPAAAAEAPDSVSNTVPSDDPSSETNDDSVSELGDGDQSTPTSKNQQLVEQEEFRQIVEDVDYLQIRDMAVDFMQSVSNDANPYNLNDFLKFLEAIEEYSPTDLQSASIILERLNFELERLNFELEYSNSKLKSQATLRIIEYINILISKVESRRVDYLQFLPFDSKSTSDLVLTRRLPQIVTVKHQTMFQFTTYLYADVFVEVLKKEKESMLSKVSRVAVSTLTAFSTTFILWEVYQIALGGALGEYKAQLLQSAISNSAAALLTGGSGAVASILLNTIAPFIIGNAGKILAQAFTPQWIQNRISAETITWLKEDGAALSTSIATGFNVGFATYAWLRSSDDLKDDQLILYNLHLKTLTGKPPNSCVLNGNFASKNIRESIQAFEKEFGVVKTPSVIYNASTRQRFVFYEHYYLIKDKMNDVDLVHTQSDWVRVPDSNALTLLPPSDVADTLYECQQLRNIPVTQYSNFAFGSATGEENAFTPSQLAARQAFVELRQAVRRSRFYFKGTNLAQSASDELLRLTSNISNILAAVYSPSGVTLVNGDDVLWTCTRSGVAARLALRHFSIFNESELKHAMKTIDLARYWTKPRIQMVAEFAAELEAEAKKFARAVASSKANESRIGIRQLASSIASSFQVVDALTALDTTYVNTRQTAFTILSSAASHDLLLNTTTDSLSSGIDEFKSLFEQGLIDVASSESVASTTIQQKPYQFSTMSSAWASRRIDTKASRKWKYGSDDGVSKLISTLSGFDLDETTKQTYYCSVGSRIELKNPNSMFMINSLSNQPVSLKALSDALYTLESKVVSTMPYGNPSSIHIDTRADAIDGLSGAAKHPLALQLDGYKVIVRLCDIENDNELAIKPDASMQKQTSSSMTVFERRIELFEALDSFMSLESEVAYESVRNKIRLSRKVAFDAERLMLALELSIHASLSETLNVDSAGIDVHLSSSPTQLVSLAIGMALKHARDGVLPDIGQVHLDTEHHNTGLELLSSLRRRADACYESYSVNTCKLSELVACL